MNTFTVNASQQSTVVSYFQGVCYYVPDTAASYTDVVQTFGSAVGAPGKFIFDPPIAISTLSAKFSLMIPVAHID